MGKRRKNGPVTVRKVDGTTEVRRASSFEPRRFSYAAYRRSAHWRRVRAERLALDCYRCAKCRGTERLEVHHRTYATLHRESMEDLVSLCQRCHATEHQWLARERRARGT